jgi:glycosyltransferase involved in cell wall biosynthesis
LVHPEWYADDIVQIHRRKNEQAALRAAAIITPSEFTRLEFLRLFNRDHDHVHVVHDGVGPPFRAISKTKAHRVAEEFGLTRRFLLYVGTRERRKNVIGLVKINALIKERLGDIMLAVVGMRPSIEAAGVHGTSAWSGGEVERLTHQLGLWSDVRFLGSIEVQKLVALYSAAEALVFPTLYEGFGLPALEAMACGTPVVASSRGAIPEVVGDAGILVNPDDHGGFADAVAALVSDAERGMALRTRGFERAAQFTWQATAKRTLEVYRAAVERHPEGRGYR